MRSHEWFINLVRGDHDKRSFNFCSRPMVLLTWNVNGLMCSSNVKDVSNIKRKCFCDETCWTGLLLKRIDECTTFLTLRVKITSCVCLDGSGSKLIFHEEPVHFFCLNPHKVFLAVTFGSFIFVNKEVPSGKNFEFDLRFSTTSFI